MSAKTDYLPTAVVTHPGDVGEVQETPGEASTSLKKSARSVKPNKNNGTGSYPNVDQVIAPDAELSALDLGSEKGQQKLLSLYAGEYKALAHYRDELLQKFPDKFVVIQNGNYTIYPSLEAFFQHGAIHFVQGTFLTSRIDDYSLDRFPKS